MLKIAIDTGYTKQFKGSDTYGARLFMQNLFSSHGIELVRVSVDKFNNKKQYFEEYNILDALGKNKTIQKKYTPDVVRSRKSTATKYKYEVLQHFIVTPSEKISVLGNDKFENYSFLKKYQPLTVTLSSFFCNTTVQKSFKDKIVLKPIRANGGKGIILTTSTELLKKRKKYHGLEELYIVQQFKNFTQGYPGICRGNHDVRFMFAGNKIIEITLRIPKKGDFRSNLGSGGTQENLPKSKIPKKLFLLSKAIYRDLHLDNTDIFSMDFAYCTKEKRRYLLEINASPGTWFYQEDKKILTSVCSGLVSFFKRIAITKK